MVISRTSTTIRGWHRQYGRAKLRSKYTSPIRRHIVDSGRYRRTIALKCLMCCWRTTCTPRRAFDEYFGALKDDGGYLCCATSSTAHASRCHRDRHSTPFRGSAPRRPFRNSRWFRYHGSLAKPGDESAPAERRATRHDPVTLRRKSLLSPGAQNNTPGFARLLEAVERGTEKTFIAELSEDVSPISDNRPFFYEFSMNWQQSPALRLLLKILWWVGGIAMVLIILPLCIVRLDKAGLTGRLWGAIGYFVAIGFGFMFVEIGLIQSLVLFLGHPSSRSQLPCSAF